jgi:G3E family GTPase
MTTEKNTRVPVTILTGFLGSGKTTLLNRILSEQHGQRIAVIENEFGETGIDNELLIQGEEQIVEMNNGCICCTVRGDLVRILSELARKREQGTLNFDRVIIETTGLADPAPVAQTFFVEPEISFHYLVDAILTVVDAKHALKQLDSTHEAEDQIGFADRLLISKVDLVTPEELDLLTARLKQINLNAPIKHIHFGKTAINELLDIRSFDLNAILEIEPNFLNDVSHHHDKGVSSFAYHSDIAFDAAKIISFMELTVSMYGNDLLRYKGILNIQGCDRKVIFQGVHMMFDETLGIAWKEGEKRASTLVFIGRNLPPKQDLKEALDSCRITF